MTREEKRALIQKVIVTERSRSEIPVVFLIDAFDHQNISPELTECVELAREAFPDASVKFVNLEEMGKELEQYRALMPQKTGELISPVKDKTFYNNRIPHTLSSRYDLKHQNALCQTMLEKWADPLTVVCSFTDTPIRKAYSDQAWKWLMQNHPHDSICGCSIEQVHTDMKYRFDQVREIGYEICSHGLETLTDTFPKDHKSQTRLLSIANPLPYPVDNVITVELYFHLDYPEQFSEPFGYESKNCFKILSADGLEVPYHIEKISRREFRHVCGQHQDYFDIHTVSFRANLLPCGITEFRVIPSKTPVRYFGSLLTAPLKAENERLAVEISPFGSLTVRSKETGKSYENLLKVIDDGEIGDGWYHQNPVDDVAVHSAGAAAISVVCDSFDKCVFKITTELRVPEKLDRIDRQIPRLSRSKDTKTLVLHHFVTLKSGAKAVEVETVVENNVEDHRLRLIIPTKSDASRYFAGEAFCFVERPCGFDHNTHDWKEQDPPERPMNGMVGKRDKDGDGLAFLSADGLSECAAYLDKDGIIAVTLLRCFGTAINFYIEKGGQIAGDHHFRYALYPFSKEETYGGFQRFTDQMAAGIQKAEKRISDSFIPNNRQFMELEGDSSLCYSTMKLPEAGEENAVVVRVFNLSDTASKGKLTFSCKIDTADFVNLLEEPLKAAAHDSHSVSLSAEPWKILTLKVTLS
jgi:alpha-mannosidase/mannosylglycerate hydrolase